MDLQTKVEDLEKWVSSIQKKGVTNLDSRLTALDTRVTSLENAEPAKVDVVETFNMGIEEELQIDSNGDNGPKADILFRCEPTAKIKGKITVNVTDIPVNKGYLNLAVAFDGVDKEVVHFDGPFESTTDIPYEFSFFPTKSAYRISLAFVGIDDVIIKSALVEIEGRNILILNRNHEFYHQEYNGIHYMTFQNGRSASYLEQATANLDLTADKTALTDFVANKTNMNKVHKMGVYTGTKWAAYAQPYVLYISNTNRTLSFIALNGTSKKVYDDEYVDAHLFNRTGIKSAFGICAAKFNGEIYIAEKYLHYGNSVYDNHVTLNGEVLTGFVQCVPVQDFYVPEHKTFESPGFILLQNTGKLFYLPNRHATYLLEIGVGTQPNAFLQQDNETIHVYYNLCHSVYLKKLVKDATSGEYKVQSDTQVFPNVEEVWEGSSGISFQRVGSEIKLLGLTTTE